MYKLKLIILVKVENVLLDDWMEERNWKKRHMLVLCYRKFLHRKFPYMSGRNKCDKKKWCFAVLSFARVLRRDRVVMSYAESGAVYYDGSHVAVRIRGTRLFKSVKIYAWKQENNELHFYIAYLVLNIISIKNNTHVRESISDTPLYQRQKRRQK